MPLYLGSKTVSENINMGDTVIQNTFDLFDVKWSDHIINNESWMCADDFNWIDGSVFSAAWNELKSEWDLATVDSTPAQQDIIGDITISYWKSPKGYKLVEYGGDTPETNENLLQQLYDEVGIAWYYLIDTTGQIRFKLPRTKYGFVGVRSGAGNFVNESLPNITGTFYAWDGDLSGAFYKQSTESASATATTPQSAVITFDASRSSSVYQDGANVQQKSTEMHLYFYLADFVRTPLESNLNTFITETKETLNEKVNVSDYSADKTLIENDIKQLDDNAAKLGEDNTFTGVNTVNNTNPILYGKNTADLTNANGMGLSLRGTDNAGNLWSYIDLYRRGESKTSEAHMYVVNAGGTIHQIAIIINDDGTVATVAPTPPTSDNSTQIATTAWVNNKFQVVSTLPAEPDPNVYYFVTNG